MSSQPASSLRRRPTTREKNAGQAASATVRPDYVPPLVGCQLEHGELQRVARAGVTRRGRELDALDDELDGLEIARPLVVLLVVRIDEQVCVEPDRGLDGREIERRAARVARQVDEAAARQDRDQPGEADDPARERVVVPLDLRDAPSRGREMTEPELELAGMAVLLAFEVLGQECLSEPPVDAAQ